MFEKYNQYISIINNN